MNGSSTVSQKSSRALLGVSRGPSGGVFRPNLENNDKIVIIFAIALVTFSGGKKLPLMSGPVEDADEISLIK